MRVTNWHPIRVGAVEFVLALLVLVGVTPIIFAIPSLPFQISLAGIEVIAIGGLCWMGWDIMKDGVEFTKKDNPLDEVDLDQLHGEDTTRFEDIDDL